MIVSLLYRLTPDQRRMVMIDPNMLELSAYAGIPHLLTPVLTAAIEATRTLERIVMEIYDRSTRMARIIVRSVAAFNDRARGARSTA